MRFRSQPRAGFIEGIAVGFVLGGVALLTAGAVRRVRARRLESNEPLGIDAHEPEGAALDVRPAEEANASNRRLASELPDFVPVSQRW
jgi:hypothetical protein